jgi:hypothetical protein
MVYERLSQQKITLWLPNWGIKEELIRWQNDIILMTNICTTICVSTSFHHKLYIWGYHDHALIPPVGNIYNIIIPYKYAYYVIE